MVQKDLVKAVAADVNGKYKEEGRDKIAESVVGDVIKSFGQVTSKALAKGGVTQLIGEQKIILSLAIFLYFDD